MVSFKIPRVLKMFKVVSLKVFIMSFLIGLLFLYLMGPQTKKVYVYPSPDTIDKAIFQDKANQCFLYKEETVTCPSTKKEISQIPVQ